MNEIIVFVFLFGRSMWYFSYHLRKVQHRQDPVSRIRASIWIMRLVSHREAFVCASRIIFPAFSPSFISTFQTDDFADLLLPPRSASPVTWRHSGSTGWITCYASRLHTSCMSFITTSINLLLELPLSLSPGGSILSILHPLYLRPSQCSLTSLTLPPNSPTWVVSLCTRS